MIKNERGEGAAMVLFVITIICIVLGLFWAYPQYRVYNQRLRGQAALQEAEANRRIRIFEAEAALEAAKLERQAEVERARGVAEANEIVADGLGGPEGYLRYLWIQGLQTNQMQVVYVPTEANLPLLEAGKR